MKLFKFLIPEDAPVWVSGCPYYNISSVVVAQTTDQAKTVLKNHLSMQFLPAEWVNFTDPIEVDTSIPSVVALTLL